MKEFDLSGDAPAKSRIEVVDADGRTVAKTQADSKGKWQIRGVPFAGGPQAIFARAIEPSGNVACSGKIMVGLEIQRDEEPSPADSLTDEERLRFEGEYWRYVDMQSDGTMVDLGGLKELLPLAGKSFDDFTNDVVRLRAVNEQLVALGVDPEDFALTM